MKKFEYMTSDRRLTQATLNMYGSLGWELVSHSAVADGGKMCQYYVFKREVLKDVQP